MNLPAYTASAQIEVNINGENIGNEVTPEATINSTAIQLQDIASIETTKGAIAETDWAWMQTQSPSLTKLEPFQANEQGYSCPPQHHRLPIRHRKKRAHSQYSRGERQRPHGCCNIWDIDLPAAATIGARAVKSCPNLQLIRLIKVLNIKS